MLPNLLEELSPMNDDKDPRDDFFGNPWHPFLRFLSSRTASLPPERRSHHIPMPGAGPPPTWDDLFRLDAEVGRLVPTRDLTETEIRALADWLGLAGEEHATFLELGAAFLAQRDSLRELREEPWLPEDEEPSAPRGPPRLPATSCTCRGATARPTFSR
jgi:hypothetical protein